MLLARVAELITGAPGGCSRSGGVQAARSSRRHAGGLGAAYRLIATGCGSMASTAKTPGREADIGWLGAVDHAKVVQVLGARPLVAALVCRQQRLAESGWRAAFVFV